MTQKLGYNFAQKKYMFIGTRLYKWIIMWLNPLLHVCIIPGLVEVLPARVKGHSLTGTAGDPVLDILSPTVRYRRNPWQCNGVMGDLHSHQVPGLWRWLWKIKWNTINSFYFKINLRKPICPMYFKLSSLKKMLKICGLLWGLWSSVIL